MSHEYANPNLFADNPVPVAAPMPRPNTYDKNDRIKRGNVIIAGPMKLATYAVRDPETDEWGPWQFHMTYDNHVMAVMSEQAAILFSRFVNDWQRCQNGERPSFAPAPSGDGVTGD